MTHYSSNDSILWQQIQKNTKELAEARKYLAEEEFLFSKYLYLLHF
jgi:adenylate kinase family enzyme